MAAAMLQPCAAWLSRARLRAQPACAPRPQLRSCGHELLRSRSQLRAPRTGCPQLPPAACARSAGGRDAPPEERRQVVCTPDVLLRAVLQLDSARAVTPPWLLQDKETCELLRRAPELLHSMLVSFGEGGRHQLVTLAQPCDASRAADIASAQRGLLRLLDALDAACPQLLRGKHADLGVEALLRLQGQHVRMTFPHDCFRRAHFLVMLATSAPESTWGRPPETWEPPAGESMDLVLQSFVLHVIGPRFDLPEFLRCALEAAVLRKPADCDPHLFPIVTKIARGDSARKVLQHGFPTLVITRATAHAFMSSALDSAVPHRAQTHDHRAAPESPVLCALRCAQVQALGFHPADARIIATHLLQPELYDTRVEEELLMAAAGWLAEQHRGLLAHASHGIGCNPVAIDDLAFFLDVQLNAARRCGRPLCDAFSFKGRTLKSLGRLVQAHRREALVSLRRHGREDNAFPAARAAEYWHTVLLWDEECSRMLDRLQPPRADAAEWELSPLDDRRWPATVRVPGIGDVPGEWHMRELCTLDEVREEGEQQQNCLRRQLDPPDYGEFLWSLRFHPDAPWQLPDDVPLRATVQTSYTQVEMAEGPDNTPCSPEVVEALCEWAEENGVDIDDVQFL